MNRPEIRPRKSYFRGCLTALPTPFRNGRIDFPAVHSMIRRQIDGGIDGLVLGGSTGESCSLARNERLALFEFAVGSAGGRVPVIAGLGSGDTRSVCDLAQAATGLGVAGLMVTAPAYTRPSSRGLEAHFGAVAASTSLPILLYNIPSRTGVDLDPETAGRIAKAHSNVVAIKESSSLARLAQLIEALDILVLSGEDQWIIDAMELGCSGVVAVISNLMPDRVARLVHAFDADGEGGRESREIMAEAEAVRSLATVLSIDSNPGPLKAACALMGLSNAELRLPLVPVDEADLARIREGLRNAGLEA